MSSGSIKKWCAMLCAISLGFMHASFLCLYLLPLNPLSNIYREFVNWYIEPIFSQNWKLFAPDPQPYSLKVFYKCGNDKWWYDPVQSVLETHQKSRLSYHGKLLYVYNSLIRNLLNSKYEICKDSSSFIECQNPVSNTKVLKDTPYKKMEFFISQYCQNDKIIFRVARVYSIKFSERNTSAKRKIIFDEYRVN